MDDSPIALAILDRLCLGVTGFGPLTQDEQSRVDAYEKHMAEEDAEYEARRLAGGRMVCPKCGNRSVKERAVLTYGTPNNVNSEYSMLTECEKCDYSAL